MDMFSERAQAKYAPDLWEALDGETIVDSSSDPADLKTTNTASSGGANTLTDSSKSWTNDEWINYSVYIKSGTGAEQIRRITDNDGTVLTVTPNWTTNPDNTSKYQIFIGDNPESSELISRNQLSRYAIKATKGAGHYQVRFRIDRTGVASIDLQDRFTSFNFSIWEEKTAGGPVWRQVPFQIVLTDTNGDQVRIGKYDNEMIIGNECPHLVRKQTPKWTRYTDLTFPDGFAFRDAGTITEWGYTGGSTTFDPTQVKYFDIKVYRLSLSVGVWIDRLYFGGGLKIDPFQNPQFYTDYASQNGDPANLDQTSIDNYGLRLYHHTNREINSFAQAHYEGDRVLNVLKNPLKTVVCRKLGNTWLRPNQTVDLYSTTLGIGTATTPETWRTTDLQWDWWSRNKLLLATITLVEQNAKTPPVFSPTGYIPAQPLVDNSWTGYWGSITKGGGR